MPGIAGFWLPELQGSPEDLVRRMLAADRQRPEGRLDVGVEAGSGLGLGRSGNGVLNPAPQPLTTPRGDLFVFDGELYRDRGPLPDPDAVLDLLGREGGAGLASLEGSFVFAFAEPAAGRLTLGNDRFGLKPLYCCLVDGGLLFASTIRSLLATGLVPRRRDDRSFADFYRFGHVLGDKTLFADVRLLSPGSTLVFDARAKSARVEQHWAPGSLFVDRGAHDEGADPRGVADAFVRATRLRLGHREDLGVSLSGGLDSRAVLAAMGEGARGVHSYTLGLEGCQDQQLSARMAEVAGTRHVFLTLGKDYLGDYEGLAGALVGMSDGLYHPHESTEKLALDYFAKSPFRIVLRGHGGELAKASLAYPVAVTPEVSGFARPGQIVDYLFDRANLVLRDLPPQGLFRPEFHAAMDGAARESLREAVAPVADRLAPADVCIYYYLTQWVRRQVVASLEIFRTQVDVRLPFLDGDFLSLLFRLPVRRRFAGEIQTLIVSRCAPALVKIPNSNTGAPLDAGAARLFLTDKLNSLLKRLSIKGFRHYTEFQEWQRDYFRTNLEKILFDARTLDRGLYQPEGLRSVFDAHVSGARNHGHLLGTMVGLELWYRKFVDR